MLSQTAFGQAPVLNFTFTSGILNPGDTVTFTNTSTGFPSGTQFIWNFGERCYNSPPDSLFNVDLCNDTTVGLSSITHVYYNRKAFLVTLKVNVVGGVNLSLQKYVVLKSHCNCLSNSCGNLICNSDFSQHTFCYDLGGRLGYIDCGGSISEESSTCWYEPNSTLSADLFMTLATISCINCGTAFTHTEIPTIQSQCQDDHSPFLPFADIGYVGIIGVQVGGGAGREYIQQHLANPITIGDYDITFWVSLRDWSANASNIGMLISQAPPLFHTATGITDVLDATPTVDALNNLNTTGNFITDKLNWTEIRGIYSAVGNEKFISIGNFDPTNDEVDAMDYVGNDNAPTTCLPPPGQSLFVMPYYLIDDVSITKHLELETTRTPACNGLLNGSIAINNVEGTFWPYTFNWSNGASTQNISGLTGGTYTVTVTDKDGCSKAFIFNVPSGNSPIVPVVTGDHSLCTTSNTYVVDPSVWDPALDEWSNDYTWIATDLNGVPLPGGNGSSVFAYFVFGPNGGIITFTATNPITGCTSTSEPFIVAPCCEGTYTITNLNVAQAMSQSWGAFQNYNGPGVGIALFSNETVAINGVFTIEQDFTIDHSKILLGPDAVINILPNVNVTFTGGSHLHTCRQDYMWRGITVNDNSFLNIFNTTLEESQITVNCLSGGTVNTSTQTIFNANFKSIQFDLGNANHNGEIQKTTFGCNDLTSGNPITLIPPHLGQNPDCGIEINDAASIKIGNENNTTYSPPSHQNLFRHLNFGIKLINSNAEIVNNKFDHIQRYQDDVRHTSGFCIDGSSTGNNFSAINIGGGNLPSSVIYRSNEFENSLNGIRLHNQVNCEIVNNKFVNIKSAFGSTYINGTCIHLNNHQLNTLIVRNNFLDNFDRGVTAVNLTDITINVENNYLNATSKYANYEAKIGIRISRIQMVNVFTSLKEVHSNVIKHAVKGMYCQGAQGLNIHDNTIEFDPADIAANPVYRYGIHIIGGGASGYGIHNIESNWIYKTGSVFNLADEKLTAINIQSSGKNDVVSNLINKMGVGVYFGTTTMGNKVHCNEMNDCLTGVRFDAADIGNQGTPGPNGISQGNKWNYSCVGCYALKKVLSATTPTWYVESSAPVNTLPSYPNGLIHMSPPSFVTMDNGNNDILPAVDCNVPCPTCPPPRMADIVTGSGEFANMSPDERYRALNEIYRILNADTFYMYMGLPSDIILQNFYDSAYFTNIGMLTIVDELIADSLNLFAGMLNSWISPINHFEENAAIVNELFVTCCINGDCVFDSIQYSTLYAIASENPLTGGDAVYKAREMLDVMFDDYLTEPTAKFSNQIASSMPIEITVYPNPSKNYFEIDLDNLGENDKWCYTIRDYLGKIVTQKESINLSNTIVNTIDFQQGVYLLQVTINNKKNNLKVVVIK